MSQVPISFVFRGILWLLVLYLQLCWTGICFFLYYQFLCVNKFVLLEWKLQKLIYSSADGLDAFASFGKLPNDPFKTYNNTYIILINAGSCNEVTVVQYTSLLAYTYIWIFDIFLNSIQYKVWWSVSRLILWKISTGNSDPNKFLPPSHCAQNEESKPFCHVESRDFLIFSRQAMNVTLM